MKNRYLWSALIFPPVLFLLTTALISLFYGISGVTDSEEIARLVTSNIPLVLLITQLLILCLLVGILRKEKEGIFRFRTNAEQVLKVRREVLSGVALGAFLAGMYILLLSPIHTYLQITFGDYVPAGQVMLGLSGGSVVAFFIANVALAPFVEERLYRGYGVLKLKTLFGSTKAVLISSLFFGLLHWMGGFWYMVLTGGVIGLIFGTITVKRQNIILVFSAHLSLNIIEFVYIALL